MNSAAIQVSALGKLYRLGQVGATTLREDVQRFWARARGQEDPTSKIGQPHLHRKDGACYWALRDVSFEVRQGAVLGIIGRNGAGKSTLLKILSRITSPTEGRIRMKGRVASLLEVGTGFHPELTGRENIFLNGAILGMSHAEVAGKFDAIVAFSEIEEFIDTPVKRYSSGMYVRLAFAVAAHLDPEILIVDEVLAVGDIDFQKKCLGKMSDIVQGGRTILFVSHNMPAIARLTNQCLVLRDGAVAYHGPTEAAISFYAGDHRQQTSNGRKNVSELECENRVTLDNKVVFEELGFPDEQTAEINPEQDFKLEIVLKSTQTFELLNIGFTVRDEFGNPVLSGFSDAFSLNHIAKQVCTLVIPNLRLAPGRYDLHISVMQGTLRGPRKTFDTLFGVCPFNIKSHFKNGDFINEWHQSYGRLYHEHSYVKC